MLNRPLVVPLALFYLALQGLILLLAILDKTIPAWLTHAMPMICWAGAIEGLFWLATSPWGKGAPAPEPPGEKSTLSKFLTPLAVRADAIANCDLRTWGTLVLRLLMVCGVALIATRFAVMAALVVLIFLMLFHLTDIHWVAVCAIWLLFFTLFTHMHFIPLASFIVVVVPVLLLVLRPEPADMSHGIIALACAGMGLLWELQGFEQPPSPLAFLIHVLQTASNLQAMLPGLFLGAAMTCAMPPVEPPRPSTRLIEDEPVMPHRADEAP